MFDLVRCLCLFDLSLSDSACVCPLLASLFILVLALLVGWGEFRFFRLGRGNDGLKVDNLSVDHEKMRFTVTDPILAFLLAIF